MFSDTGNAMDILIFYDTVYGSNSYTKNVPNINNKSTKQCFSGKTTRWSGFLLTIIIIHVLNNLQLNSHAYCNTSH